MKQKQNREELSMEKAAKLKNRVLKFLTGAASAVSFQNPPLSPNRDKRFSHATAKGFSGHVVSLVPQEARRKNKQDDTEEPNSPKVSCMGQIKQRKRKCRKTKHSKPTAIGRIFAVKTGAGDVKNKQLPVDRAPSLEKLKRFSSGRDTFASFDWTAQIIPVEFGHRDYCSDEDVEGSNHEEVIVPFSAVELKARKEVNLWKRRTMAPPIPLLLH